MVRYRAACDVSYVDSPSEVIYLYLRYVNACCIVHIYLSDLSMMPSVASCMLHWSSDLGYFYTYEDCEVIVNVTALKIHLSENAHDALKAFPEFVTEPRGEIFIKVK